MPVLRPPAQMMAQQQLVWLVSALLWWSCMLSATTVSVVQAYSTGPGGCMGGTAASTGHPVPNPLLTFADLGYYLQVNGTEVVSTTTTTTLPPLIIGTTYELSVRTRMAPFKGALIRVDGLGDLVAGENAAAATACSNLGEPNVEGVGHTNKIDKTVLSGFYTVTGGSAITVDVTVVQSLATGYSHHRYTLDVAAAATAPVPAPVVAKTTAAPVAAKTTEAPVATKTTKAPVAPIVAPAPAPATTTTNTTKAPVAPPAPTMTNNTTKAPAAPAPTTTTNNTTKAPVAAPAPTTNTTKAPVAAPAPAPTTNTTNTTKAPVAAPVPEKCVRRRRQA